MKTDMSSFDIMAMVEELPAEMRIKKVYQPSPSELRIQVRLQEGETRNLLVEIGKSMYLSDFSLPSPKYPSNFAMTLRKYLSNGVVKEVRQVGFDRIVELTVSKKEGDYRLVLELFGEGNAVLVDPEGAIKTVMKPKRFKHRELLGKREYLFPPQRKNPFLLSADELAIIIKDYGSLVKALASPLGLGGQYAEEVCFRAGLDKNKELLNSDEAIHVVETLKHLQEDALNPVPRALYEEGEAVDVTPTPLKIHENLEFKEFESYNSALDSFFTKKISDKIDEEETAEYKKGLTSISMRLRDQARTIKKFTDEIEKFRIAAETVYSNFEQIQEIIDTLSKARKSHSDSEIKSRIKETDFIKSYHPKENAVGVSLGGVTFMVDLSLPAAKNADVFYKKSKKSKEKLSGAKIAASNTKQKIREYVEKGRQKQKVEKTPAKLPQRKRKWFEKFRWFVSSDGFLVLGGRDASSNELIVKRHMDSRDIFVHADVHGAPAVVIKSEGQDVSDATIEEACLFAASNSSVWKMGAAYLEVYWVLPEQVSKTPESGEYVAKGAFIIRGKRNYKRAKLELTCGVSLKDGLRVLCGPNRPLEQQCDYHARIIPGRLKSKETASKIREIMSKQASEEDKSAIKNINLDELQKLLPVGGSSVIEGGR